MLAFLLRRLAQGAVVMLTVAFLAFMLFQYVGDPVTHLLGQDALQLSDDGRDHQVLVTCPVKAHQPPLPGYDRTVETDLER